MANRHSNKPILMARNGQIKLLPLYMEPPIAVVDGTDIVTGGCAPLVVTLNGVTEWCYIPSDLGTIDTGGAAISVVTIGGLLCVTYPAMGGVQLGGAAPFEITLGGVTTWCYPAFGGITMGGEADTSFTIGSKKVRGGKGTPFYKRQPQRTIHMYEAEAFFENTLQLGGEASTMFTPARFQFIKSLPKLPARDLYQDSEFKNLYDEMLKRQPSTTFEYVAEPSNMKIGGSADEDYFDFTNFIIMHDEDVIIADILSTEGNPFITTTFSQNLQKQRRDDDDILEILELL